ncbi:MAG: archease [Endomicrobia bacterium]|nr:archease [Endomicrobiia bacterium]
MEKFKIIEHTADIGIKTYGVSLGELFENAAYGMYNIICEKFHNINKKEKIKNKTEAIDLESLLVNFLNDLLFYTFEKKMLFSEFNVDVFPPDKNFKNYYCLCTCIGDFYSKQEHGHLREIKSATFHNLKIEKTFFNYEAVVIFDL